MEKDFARQKNNEIKGGLSQKKNEEKLEISSTGYGFESVPQKSKNKNHPNM